MPDGSCPEPHSTLSVMVAPGLVCRTLGALASCVYLSRLGYHDSRIRPLLPVAIFGKYMFLVMPHKGDIQLGGLAYSCHSFTLFQ